ncbi:FtsX-like permease family protein [Haloactinopolyspora alba]
MIALAVSSLRHRKSTFVATFLSLFLGGTIVMAFAAMFDTGTADGVDSTTSEALVTMASVVGGWGLIIVAFAVVSTLTMSVRQRSSEMALLKNVGATPGQVSRLIVGETLAVAFAAALLAVAPAALTGKILLEILQETGQAGEQVGYVFGPVALSVGFAVTVLGAATAATVAARRTSRMRARDAVAAAALEQSGMSRKRKIAAWVFIALGVDLGVVTATVFNGEGVDAMQTAGQASIWFAIGLALLSPALLRMVTNVVGALLSRLGAGGWMATQNMRQRVHQMGGALMPIILFTGIATGTLYMQSIENAAAPVANTVTTAEEAQTIETLNLVVVGMIALFAAVMVINTLVSATTYRRQEFGQQRLAGSTPQQVLRMVGAEGAVLASAGVLFGSIASIATVIPYSIARTDSVLPDVTVLLYVGIVSAAALLTLASSLGAARKTISTPAVEAVAV